MDLYLSNTLSKSKEKFVPLMSDPSNNKTSVGIYSCWPTVYGDPHIWNLRAFFIAGLLGDTIGNILGLPVTHVMNITDVGHLTSDGDHGEDKMEKGSRKEGLSARDIAKKYENNFLNYINQLRIHFDHHPKATDYIQEQINIVKQLETNWYTYRIDEDGIYMDTSKISDYGKLLPEGHLKGIQSWARVDIEGKKNATDFALWKFSPKDQQRQMERPSPRWIGFPGWHIECNAMSRAFLGDHFDIHTGGIDHIPVHHTDEIAQAECSYAGHDHPWVKYRLHCQFLNIKGEKISKSLGNVFSLPDIIEKGYSALDLRYFFLMAHYSSFQDFDRPLLESAKQARKNLIKKLQTLWSEKNISWLSVEGNQFYIKCISHLLDDLETGKLIAEINKELSNPSYEVEEILTTIAYLDEKVLKIWLFEEEKAWEIPSDIKEIAHQRREAKKNKDFSVSDSLRNQLLSKWREIKDTKDWYEIIQW